MQADLDAENSRLLSECEQHSEQTASLQHEIVNWKKVVDKVKASNMEKELKVDETRKQKDELEQKLEVTKKQITRLQETEKNWQERYQQLECDKAKIMKSENSLHVMEQQQTQIINDYKKQVTKLEKELFNLKESQDQLQDNLTSCKDDSGELRQAVTEYKSTIAELQVKVESLQDDKTTTFQKHQLELDSIKKQGDEYKRKIKELEKQLQPEPSKPNVERVLSLLSQNSMESIPSQETKPSRDHELELIKEQHLKEMADLTTNYESVVDGLKQECHEMKQQLEKLALELSATPSRVEPKQFPLLTDEVHCLKMMDYIASYVYFIATNVIVLVPSSIIVVNF